MFQETALFSNLFALRMFIFFSVPSLPDYFYDKLSLLLSPCDELLGLGRDAPSFGTTFRNCRIVSCVKYK